MKLIRRYSEAGFSMVQALVLAAGLAGMALVGTKIVTSEKEVLKDVETRDQVDQVNSMIFSVLQNRMHCYTTLASNAANVIQPNTTYPFTGIYMQNSTIGGAAVDAFLVNNTSASKDGRSGSRYLGGAVRIASMSLRTPADLSQASILTIDYVRLDGSRKGTGSENFRKTMGIVLQRSAANSVKSCQSTTTDGNGVANIDELQKEICEDMKVTTWDPVLRNCKLKTNNCPTDKVFDGLDPAGNVICTDFVEYLPYIVSTGPSPFDCPADFNTLKFARELNDPGADSKLVLECNKTNHTCASQYQKEWSTFDVGTTYCYGNLPRGTEGQVVETADITPNPMGKIKYKCVNETWVETTGKTCVAPSSARTMTWGSSPRVCSANLADSKNWYSQTIADTTEPVTGVANYRCENGVWTQKSATCVRPCEGKKVIWSVNSDSCEAVLPFTLDNLTITAVDAIPASVGKQNYKCNGGTWTTSGSPTCDDGKYKGICKWNKKVTWPEEGCFGFQQPPETINGSKEVKTPAQCTAICNPTNCDVDKTYQGCTYTPY